MKRTPLARKTPLKRKKPLARVSKRRRSLNALLNPGRVGFLLLVETCMVCNKADACDCHEICRGPHREECLHHPRLWLAVCRSCHELMDDYSKWPIEKQLAIRLEWEIRKTIFEANEVRGRPQTAIEYGGVAKYLA